MPGYRTALILRGRRSIILAHHVRGREASVNLAHVVASVEFVAVEMADLPNEKDCQIRARVNGTFSITSSSERYR
jgi:hypothetical protein